MSDRGHEYERYAAECRALAAQMKDPKQRATMLRLAATWEKLARESRRRPAPLPVNLAETSGSDLAVEPTKAALKQPSSPPTKS